MNRKIKINRLFSNSSNRLLKNKLNKNKSQFNKILNKRKLNKIKRLNNNIKKRLRTLNK
jgi:hypothetical protein